MLGVSVKLQNSGVLAHGVSVNGFDYEKRTEVFKYEEVLIANNQEIGRINGHHEKDANVLEINVMGQYFKVCQWYRDNNISESVDALKTVFNAIKDKSVEKVTELIFPKIYNQNNQEIAIMAFDENFHDNKNTGFVFKFNGMNLYLRYAHKLDSVNYCIFNDQNQLVAVVKKKWKGKYNPATNIYCMNDSLMPYIYMIYICTILSEDSYQNDGARFTSESSASQYYDEEFIKNIEASVGPNNIPENMSLYQEYLQKAKTDNKSRNVGKIVLLILVLVIFGAIIFMAMK